MKLDYKAMFLKKSWFKSFTLIELSVVLFVIAILSTTGIGIYKKMNPQHASDVKKMKEIQLALDRYFAVHKRLPRPANITVLPTLVDFGKEVNLGVNPGFRKQSFGGTSGRETGFIVGGGLPVVELGLDNSYAFDSYGNRIEYWTHDLFTRSLGVSYSGLCDSTNCKYYRIQAPSRTDCVDTACNQIKHYVNSLGEYIVTDSTNFGFAYANSSTGAHIGNSFPYNMKIYDEVLGREVLKTKHNTAYVLVSHGKSGLCAYSRTSTTATTAPTDNRKFNCISYWNTGSNYVYSTGAGVKDASMVFHMGYSKSFDNLVYFKTLDQLVADASAIRKFATG